MNSHFSHVPKFIISKKFYLLLLKIEVTGHKSGIHLYLSKFVYFSRKKYRILPFSKSPIYDPKFDLSQLGMHYLAKLGRGKIFF